MELKRNPILPATTGAVVDQYLQTLMTNVEYKAWTITDSFDIEPCVGIIQNNQAYNPHHAIDTSQNELYIITNNGESIKQWFTTNHLTAQALRHQQLLEWHSCIVLELSRISHLLKLYP